MKTVTLLILLVGLCNCDTSSEEVKNAFIASGIVPDILNCPPGGFLEVLFDSGVEAKLGNELTPDQVKDEPTVSWEAENGAYYTIIMADPDVPSRANHTERELRHWEVINIRGSSPDRGEVVYGFLSPTPTKGVGDHRYVLLLFKQLEKILYDGPRVPSGSLANRTMTSTRDSAKKYNLGKPILGNFFLAQQN